jgi:hypothetical protein
MASVAFIKLHLDKISLYDNVRDYIQKIIIKTIDKSFHIKNIQIDFPVFYDNTKTTIQSSTVAANLNIEANNNILRESLKNYSHIFVQTKVEKNLLEQFSNDRSIKIIILE